MPVAILNAASMPSPLGPVRLCTTPTSPASVVSVPRRSGDARRVALGPLDLIEESRSRSRRTTYPHLDRRAARGQQDLQAGRSRAGPPVKVPLSNCQPTGGTAVAPLPRSRTWPAWISLCHGMAAFNACRP